VLDPPRAGASRQAASIAGADIPVVAYASCDPRSFARDARLLCDGGYRLVWVTPVDQFLFTPHVELVGIFRKV
jgi:23S rRNA (uracil1939-C5)-methyltransferase